MQKRFKLLNLLVCSALTSQVYATTDIIDDFLSLNGFGTVGVTHSSNKNGDVVSNILRHPDLSVFPGPDATFVVPA